MKGTSHPKTRIGQLLRLRTLAQLSAVQFLRQNLSIICGTIAPRHRRKHRRSSHKVCRTLFFSMWSVLSQSRNFSLNAVYQIVEFPAISIFPIYTSYISHPITYNTFTLLLFLPFFLICPVATHIFVLSCFTFLRSFTPDACTQLNIMHVITEFYVVRWKTFKIQVSVHWPTGETSLLISNTRAVIILK